MVERVLLLVTRRWQWLSDVFRPKGQRIKQGLNVCSMQAIVMYPKVMLAKSISTRSTQSVHQCRPSQCADAVYLSWDVHLLQSQELPSSRSDSVVLLHRKRPARMLDNYQRFEGDTVAKPTVQKRVYVQEAVSETKRDINSLVYTAKPWRSRVNILVSLGDLMFDCCHVD